jgi:glycosyltransferase involved in cell wall biosynthesis
VSIVIPARNEAENLELLLRALVDQRADAEIEITVVDDGSTDHTADVARSYDARVIRLEHANRCGNPAAARNIGAKKANGDPIVFLDADCQPSAGWLAALLAAHDSGQTVVGGSLDLPPGLSWTARLDYYCGWYHVHSRRTGRRVPSHPPCNLSVRRDTFAATNGFTEHGPEAYAHEELDWQAALAHSGQSIYFEPRAIVLHRNRPGLANLMRRNYRWGYSAIRTKARTEAARWPWLYRYPRTLILARPLLSVAETGYIVSCWLQVGVFEPLLLFPFVLAARVSYGAGSVVGGIRWLRGRGSGSPGERPRWE